MANISKIITGIGKLVGSQAKATLAPRQVVGMLREQNPKVADQLSQALSRMKAPKFDVAYKVSERGFTVGAMTLRDGKNVVGNGALSVTGLGTESAVVKARLNIGKNGEILRFSGHHNYGEQIKLQDVTYNLNVKGGVAEVHQIVGKAGAGHARFDIPKATEALGVKEEAALLLKRLNAGVNEAWKKMRDLFAGKEPQWCSPTKIADKFKKTFGSDYKSKLKFAKPKDFKRAQNDVNDKIKSLKDKVSLKDIKSVNRANKQEITDFVKIRPESFNNTVTNNIKKKNIKNLKFNETDIKINRTKSFNNIKKKGIKNLKINETDIKK